ncbi:palmitoyltransferase ZDHHC22-like [Mizuhopecten yessoensis]|uniref:Palmitoyltransferase n=1 Tax=Mizuhopecten yessoensis TaxID=6573 RepID=A0A210Q8V6_MIZYE|nr:palmitoyltransferase ZDHHC22-like [Mizuhopecten yessoensis]XP_021364249.1 palmitoyltransferase ZDHHC22-like [Mizuhopecten yessoensis]OWF45177.1 palmitoyltransferase ZDHHC22 [Mizuhopecten yessoensis]
MKNIVSNVMTTSQNLISSMETMNDYHDGKEQFNIVSSIRRKVVLVNYAAMSYLLSFTVILLFVSNYLTIPFYCVIQQRSPDGLFYYKAFSWFLLVNFFMNYGLILHGAVKSLYCSPNDLPLFNARVHEDWGMCQRCDRQVPVRTRHCNICDRCVLKRDHHCYFTGSCIGFYNQRYFICLAFYSMAGALYGFYFLENYLSASYVTLFSVEFYKYFIPYTMVLWLLRLQDFGTVLLVLLLYLTFVGFGGGCYFFFWQCNLILTGQTSYELMKGKKTFQTTPRNHLRSIFGPHWYLNFLFPMPFLKSEDDGMSWNTTSTKFL